MESGQRSSLFFSDALFPVSSFSSSSFDSPPRVSYVVHPVSKTDTLPGIAIKYGVEVLRIQLCLPFGQHHSRFFYVPNLECFANFVSA